MKIMGYTFQSVRCITARMNNIFTKVILDCCNNFFTVAAVAVLFAYFQITEFYNFRLWQSG